MTTTFLNRVFFILKSWRIISVVEDAVLFSTRLQKFVLEIHANSSFATRSIALLLYTNLVP